MKDLLEFIYKEQREISIISGIGALIGWDQMTYMPAKGAFCKAEQSAWLSRIIHNKVISDKLWNCISKLSKPTNFNNLKKQDQIVLKRLEEDVEKARKIPSNFVERMAKTTTIAYQSWEKAREKQDFKMFSIDLDKIVNLEKEYCEYIDLPGPRYNSLLDDYEEGMTTDKLQEEFSFLKKNLIRILDKIKSGEKFQKQQDLDFPFDVENQRKICEIVLEKMGLTKDRSRMDASTHPFTTSIGYDDVRITTNFARPNPLFSFFSTVHESGHALYELGMPQGEYKNTVISDSPSLGLHESQSRFWENMIARSMDFWHYFYPIFRKMNPKSLDNVYLGKWYDAVNQVKPSLIRVEADELTYCLHVILRFELETDLMEDKISVSDLPELWNDKMDENFGIIPENDRDGVLQDMHWSGGNIGYFPTYAIGTIYASQLFNQLKKEHNTVEDEIRNGDFSHILQWLNSNVYRYGRIFNSENLIKKTCGEGLNSKVFIDYISDKYFGIYDV